MLLPLLLGRALAASTPDVLVVGVHVPGLVGEAANQAAAQLEEVLDASGKAEGVAPVEVSKRILGRESIVLEAFALGPGRERLREARLLYDRAQIDDAGPVVDEAITMLSRGMAVATNTRELHEALLLSGMTRLATGNEIGASEQFRRAAILDIARELDRVNYPPRVIELYDGARADVAKKAPAKVSVLTSVGATVFVDGNEIGAAPTGAISLVPGEHFVLARAAGGGARFTVVTVAPGEERVVDVALQTQGLGTPMPDNAGRSRQIRDLYRALGEFGDKGTVLLAGQLHDGQVGVQLYSPASGNFSRVVTGEAGDNAVVAIAGLVPRVVGYLAESGDIRADRVGAQVLTLDIGANPVLAGMLFDPPPIGESTTTVVAEQKGVPWWVWAGTGAVVAGAGVTVAVVLGNDGAGEGSTDDPDQGTIVLGPVP
ncbi:MAG: hypothetical protein FJ090_00915 [Deltaproteobacteria bacterium]|nr:hypothetical protein [Deltaproteobacteria bacterium]